ncbi:MAG: rhodanese-like domain-containing protein [Chlorobi bacterium]|nr:rhodanese-like domain-containing protein [Chlorobiota bacterium]
MVNKNIKGTISTIDSKSLYSKISNHIPVVLLDAREINEYKISHIKNAIYVGYNDFDIDKLKTINKNKTIIVYCSIGYRSEKVAEIVSKNGFSNVYNLYGGIFDWINQDFPVVNSIGVTPKIHPYNKEWGKWLEKGEKSYE